VVDVSLMNVGMWTMAPDIVAAPYLSQFTKNVRTQPGNPITNWYRTSDGRWIYLVLLQADRFWPELCNDVLGRPDLVTDPRFADAALRFQNKRECVTVLDEVFGSRPLAEWQERFVGFSGVWAPVLTFREVHEHRQVEPNGYLPSVVGHDGLEFRLVAPPMHFDGEPSRPSGPAPELGQHTEEILLDAGLDWDAIAAARETGALG